MYFRRDLSGVICDNTGEQAANIAVIDSTCLLSIVERDGAMDGFEGTFVPDSAAGVRRAVPADRRVAGDNMATRTCSPSFVCDVICQRRTQQVHA